MTAAADVNPTLIYGNWQSATVLETGKTADFTPDTYNNSLTANQLWMAVNTEADNQAVELNFSSVAKDLYVYAYAKTTLENGNPTASNCLNSFSVAAGNNAVLRFKCPLQGTCYFLICPRNGSNTSDKVYHVSAKLLDGDSNENNDTWDRATELTENVNTYFNINANNDTDWFKISTSNPGEAIDLIFSNFDYTVDATYTAGLYKETDGKLGSLLWSKENFTDSCNATYKANEVGDYYLKLTGSSVNKGAVKDLKLRYEIVKPDDYELNDTYETATKMTEVFNMDFTLNGKNDVDWFYFETDTVNEVVTLSFSGFEPDYSNVISCYIYNIDPTTGGQTTVTYKDRRSSNFSMTFSCEQTGGHYIKITNASDAKHDAIRNKLRLVLETNAQVLDGGEPNNDWTEATEVQLGQLFSFNLPDTIDTDWLRIHVDKPNQTLCTVFTIPAGGAIDYYLYSGEDLNLFGYSGSSSLNYVPSIGNGQHEYRWMLPESGDYYLRLNAYSSSHTFSEDGTVLFDLIEPDDNENNGTWQTATALSEGVSTVFTLPANNDTDFFSFETTEPNQTVELTYTIPAGGNVYAHLYSGEDFRNSGNNASALTWTTVGSGMNTMKWMLTEVGTYYVRLTPYSSINVFDTDATVRYRLIDPDKHERNNDWRTATALTEGVAAAFTLPATNDTDFFKVTTVKDNQTVRYTVTVPDGGKVYWKIYRGSDYEAQGDKASTDTWGTEAGIFTVSRYFEKAGDYYFSMTSDFDSWTFEGSATVSYVLLDGDGNECNQSFDQATVLYSQQTAAITLPAGNDEDWFRIDNVTPGDIITVYLDNTPSYTNTIACYIYYKGEYDTKTTVATWANWYASTSSKSISYTVQKDGTYYLRLSAASGGIDTPMYLRYSIKRNDIAVQSVSVSSIRGLPVTLVRGDTLRLFPVFTPANATNQNVTWKSSAPGVLSVDADGTVHALSNGTATITVTTEDGNKTFICNISVTDPVHPESISLSYEGNWDGYGTEDNPKVLALESGLQLVCRFEPINTSNQNVIWTVSNPAVLSVTDYGKVGTVGSGKACVTATSEDGSKTASFYISVPDETYIVKRITLNYGAVTLYEGESDGVQLIAEVHPSYATNPELRWHSSDESVVTVDESGKLLPVARGSATVTCTSQENPAIFTAVSVVVREPRIRVREVSFREASVNVGIYGEVDLAALLDILPNNATDASVSWASDNKNIVTVSRYGLVTALNIGSAEITATTTDGQKTAKITVYVSSNAALGDVNNDGSADVGDVMQILQASVGLRTLSEAQKLVADVNGDGEVDVGDAILILRYDAGLIDTFPAKA